MTDSTRPDVSAAPSDDTSEQDAERARGAWRQAMRLATDSVDGDEAPVEVVWGNPSAS